jgi:hypothetical protein
MINRPNELVPGCDFIQEHASHLNHTYGSIARTTNQGFDMLALQQEYQRSADQAAARIADNADLADHFDEVSARIFQSQAYTFAHMRQGNVTILDNLRAIEAIHMQAIVRHAGVHAIYNTCEPPPIAYLARPLRGFLRRFFPGNAK